MGDIDEALQRPGRCFATVAIRPLNAPEVRRLAMRLTNGDLGLAEHVIERALPEGARNATLATVYRALNMEKLS